MKKKFYGIKFGDTQVGLETNLFSNLKKSSKKIIKENKIKWKKI